MRSICARHRRRSSRSLLMLRGAPFLLSLLLGLFFGVGGPHFVIGKMIKRRINKFNSNFPDAIELMVRGLRSGLPITETLGIVAERNPRPGRDRVPHGLRQDEDRPDDGSGASGNRRPPRHRRVPVLRHHAGDPARDRRQPRRDPVEPRRRAAQARADEAEDPRDELGIQGFGLHRRLAAVRRLRASCG